MWSQKSGVVFTAREVGDRATVMGNNAGSPLTRPCGLSCGLPAADTRLIFPTTFTFQTLEWLF
ncbi:hypothetical protein JOE09_004319 [Pantoea coffeiphila]|nr:hypothetical protein [Pantoea coffeiphila]